MSITIFQLIDKKITLQEIEKKLNQKIDSKEVDDPSTGNTLKLKTTIEHIKLKESLRATIRYDYLDSFFDRDGKTKVFIKTVAVDFTFLHGSGIYLLLFCGRDIGEKIASQISNIVFNRQDDPILSCQIRSNDMDKFIQKLNPIIITCGWRGLNITNLQRVMINGADLEDTRDFKRFDSHGLKHNLRIKIPALQITLSINAYASLHIYTKIDRNGQERFVKDQILPLCS